MTFYFEGGLKSLVAFYNNHQTPVHKNIFYVDRQLDTVHVEVALQYVDDITSRITAFANNTYNSEGGTHITGFKTALTRSLNTYGRTANILKEKDENFTGDDVLEGITAVVSVKLPEIQFEGQTKSKLGSVEAQGAVATAFGEAFGAFLEENPDDARAIINKVLLALKARKAAKAAKDSVLRKGALEGMEDEMHGAVVSVPAGGPRSPGSSRARVSTPTSARYNCSGMAPLAVAPCGPTANRRSGVRNDTSLWKTARWLRSADRSTLRSTPRSIATSASWTRLAPT
jgi:hypothetical protein